MIQAEPVFRERHAVTSIALIVLNAEDFIDTLPIQNVSTRRPNLMVMLKSLAAIGRVQIDWKQATKYFAGWRQATGFYLLTQECELPEARVHARKLTRSLEDAATSSGRRFRCDWESG